MPETWFSSDKHYYHENIIKYCNRPFKTVEEMNEGLIAAHNSLVGPKDDWWHLGDFAFAGSKQVRGVLTRLNGRKHMVLGNHDHASNFANLVSTVQSDWFGRLGGETFHLYHFPIESWRAAGKGSIHLHGHSHGSTKSPNMLRFDVGVDCWDMKPVNLTQIIELAKRMRDHIVQSGNSLDPARNRA